MSVNKDSDLGKQTHNRRSRAQSPGVPQKVEMEVNAVAFALGRKEGEAFPAAEKLLPK